MLTEILILLPAARFLSFWVRIAGYYLRTQNLFSGFTATTTIKSTGKESFRILFLNYKYIGSLIRPETELGENSCIFCNIITKKLPHVDVYEDDNFVVLMDKYPISRGHTLIIPKIHYDNLLIMPRTEVGRLYSLVPIIAGAIVTAVRADGFNVGQNNGKAANQIVPHVHVHIIPRFNDDSTNGRWPMRRVASHEELSKIANEIKRFLNPTLVNKE